MRLRSVLSLLKWPATLALLAGVFTLAYLANQWSRARRAEEAGDSAEAPKRAANKVIKLGAQLADSLGLKDEPAQAAKWERRVPAYGRVVPNPRGTAEVRAAFAGTLREEKGGWPTLGARVQEGQVLGWLDVRVGPQERLDLVTKLSEAKLKQEGAEEHARLAKERHDRLKGAGEAISRAELDTASTQLTEARTQLATAKASVREWQRALDAISGAPEGEGKTWSQPLKAAAAGEVTELAARPGMAVEPGGMVARLVDFRLALVRLELPPESLAAGPPSAVEMFSAAGSPPALEGASNRPSPAVPPDLFQARLVGAAPQVEVASQFAAYWYEVDTGSAAAQGKASWRPGLFVKAFVKVPQEATSAVSVPFTSLLYHEGRALVYVRLSPGRFERREVRVLGAERGRWVLFEGVAAGERVVSHRAQVLLSEEFRGEADTD